MKKKIRTTKTKIRKFSFFVLVLITLLIAVSIFRWYFQILPQPAIFVLVLITLLIATSVFRWYFQVLPQPSIFLFRNVELPKKSDRILVFSPHPDDETIATGGYILESVRANASVWIVVVMNGNWLHQEQKRYKEFEEATRVLGVAKENFFFLNYPDDTLDKQDSYQVRAEFEKIILEVKPNMIIFPDTRDKNPDHYTTGKIIKEIIAENSAIANNATLYQYLVHYHGYPSPNKLAPQLYLLPPIRLVSFDYEWKRVMLPQEIEEQKLEAILHYKSQLSRLRGPFSRKILLGFVRQNELFTVENQEKE